MKNQFVATSNYQRLIEAVRRLDARGAREAGMLLVSGHPGYGKTNAVEAWSTQNNSLYLRANVDWTPRYALRALCGVLGIDPSGSADQLFQRILTRLAQRGFPAIVIDEVQHCLANGAAVLEKVRDLSDRTRSPVLLVAGEENVLRRIQRYPQIASRIAENVEFEPASVDDVKALCKRLADVEIKADLAEEIHRQSRGLVRLVMNAIANAEGVARTNSLSAIDLKTVRDAQVVLTHDWQSGRRALGRVA